MAGITHPLTERATREEYEKAHIISGYIDLVAEDADPAPPVDGTYRLVFKESGVSPNKQQTVKIVFSDGESWVLADRTI